ncbi:hypothetical protein M409DRAFT_28533 [Zasmidium cellare ATCC 36951]|uniref:Thioredoxin domain-containing protein n=1 Tax=Zasmidium cellare ATCC 36951 TaxID=1080233 RepID=A0A6A6C6D6_ZASCE|nr:uncharacterized protein M409DRAFT_28533 [Zasmidium cellare ATCC 36951]KAF2160926.1 hypothetical protein M409DRAFT_28533 [Zasmidium cellare ATCC 36951]
MKNALIRATNRLPRVKISSSRPFSSSAAALAKNRIYPARIRNEDELQTLILMSASSRVPLITFWMTTWSPGCDQVSPIIRELIERDRVGEDRGGVSFVEVESDSPDLGGLSGIAQRYMVNSIPTLLAFDRSEAQVETKVTNLEEMKSRAFLTKWIENEAARHGQGGGGTLGGLLGR